MPRINQYTDNTTIENDDKMLTYDTQGAATKLTAFSTIWNWIVSKLHALTSSSAALTPSTDRVLMDKNGTMTRVDPASVAKYGIETYNGSTIAGSAQTVKSALDTLNSKLLGMYTVYQGTVRKTESIDIEPVSAHTVYIVRIGNWNTAYLLAVFPNDGSNPIVRTIASYTETPFSNTGFTITNNGTWGIKITNTSTSLNHALTVIAIKGTVSNS